MFESALEAGFSAAGVDISLLGPMPTPGIAYLTRTARAQAGIVISASHNKYDDNGIKFFSTDGIKLPDEIELEIERVMEQPMQTVSSANLGRASRYPDAAGRYIEFCKSTIPNTVTLKGIKVVVDCANGAAYHIAPDVFSELGAEVTAIGNSPDGFNINDNCGSTYPQLLQQVVIDHKADIGIALDGDSDRVILVDENGECVDGDQILYILGMERKKNNCLQGGIVGTVMSNFGLEKSCQSNNIPFERAQVGDRYVIEALKKNDWILGGEASGHIICLDKSTTGDGIVAALEMLLWMVSSGKPLSALKSGMDIYPQTMINVKLPSESTILATKCLETDKGLLGAMKDAQRELSGEGRIVLRPSGTEPVVRIMVEGREKDLVAQIGQNLAIAVESAITKTVA